MAYEKSTMKEATSSPSAHLGFTVPIAEAWLLGPKMSLQWVTRPSASRPSRHRLSSRHLTSLYAVHHHHPLISKSYRSIVTSAQWYAKLPQGDHSSKSDGHSDTSSHRRQVGIFSSEILALSKRNTSCMLIQEVSSI